MAAGRIVVAPWFPARDRNGRLVGGALLTVWADGTTTKAAIYADAGLTTPLTNPVAANGSGAFPAIWAEAGTADEPVLYTVGLSGPDGESLVNPGVLDGWQPSLDGTPTQAALAEAAAAAAEDFYRQALEIEASGSEAAAIAAARALAEAASEAVQGLEIINDASASNAFAGGAGNTTLTGHDNVGYGWGAGNLLTDAFSNVLIGKNAGALGGALSLSIAIGDGALSKVPGIADGSHAADTNMVAIGTSAVGDTSANPQHGVAVGYFAASKIGSVPYICAVGYQAMQDATTADACVAIGAKTLLTAQGMQSTAVGHLSLFSTTTGQNLTAVGVGSGHGNTTGSTNVFVGYGAGAGGWSGLPGQVDNTTGGQNTFVGPFAGCSTAGLTGATAIGARATVGADYTVAIGAPASQGVYQPKVVIGGSTADERLHVKDGNLKVEGSVLLAANGRVSFDGLASIRAPSENQIRLRNAADNGDAALFTGQITAAGEGYFGGASDIRIGGAYGEQGVYRAGAMTVRSDAGLKLVGTEVSVEGAMALNSTIRTHGYTVATLPAAGTAGRRAYVTDATAPTFLGALTGGGAVRCPVFDNGTAWVAG